MGLTHVAQLRISLLNFNFGEVSCKATIRCCVRAGILSGFPSSSEGSGHAGRVTLPWDPRFCPSSLGGGGRGATALPADGDGTPSLPFRSRGTRDPTMRSPRSATLPWFRAGGGYSVPLFAARSRHEKPYPPMSKISFAFPFTVPSKGNTGKYTPFPRPAQAGFWKLKFRARFGACGDNASTHESRKVPRMGQYASHAWSYMCPTRGAICVPRVGQAWFHAWDRYGSTRGTGQVSSVKQAGGHGMRMFGGLLERQLPFKRVKTAVVSFMLPLDACLAMPSKASQACPTESLKYLTLPLSSMRPYRSQV